MPKFSAVQRDLPSGETRKNRSSIYNGRTRRPRYYCTVTREVKGPEGATPGARSHLRAPAISTEKIKVESRRLETGDRITVSLSSNAVGGEGGRIARPIGLCLHTSPAHGYWIVSHQKRFRSL